MDSQVWLFLCSLYKHNFAVCGFRGNPSKAIPNGHFLSIVKQIVTYSKDKFWREPKAKKKDKGKKKSATEPMAKWESMVLFVFKTLKCTFNHDAQAHFDWNSFEVATNTLRRVCFVFNSTASCVESADGFLLWRHIEWEKRRPNNSYFEN